MYMYIRIHVYVTILIKTDTNHTRLKSTSLPNI